MSKNTYKNIPRVLELLPAVATVIVALYFTIKAQFSNITTDTILSQILAIISLLATTLLVDRLTKLNRIENSTNELVEIFKTKEGKIPLTQILGTRQELLPLEQRLADAKEIFITGGSLLRLSSEYIGTFEKLLKEGCKIKLLLLDPDSGSAELTANNIVYEIKDYEAYKSYINTSIRNFICLQLKYPQQIEIRKSTYLPSFSLFGINASSDTGRIMVELYPHDVPTRERPHFQVVKKREPDWYSFFFRQFDIVWGSSVIINNQMNND